MQHPSNMWPFNNITRASHLTVGPLAILAVPCLGATAVPTVTNDPATTIKGEANPPTAAYERIHFEFAGRLVHWLRPVDERSIVLIVQGPSDRVEESLAKYHLPPIRSYVDSLQPHRTKVTLVFPGRLGAARVFGSIKASKRRQRQDRRRPSDPLQTNNVVHVEATIRSRMSQLRERLTAPVPRHIPSLYTGAAFRPAEALVRREALVEARSAYAALDGSAYIDWSAMRRGDISFLEGDRRGACAAYLKVIAAFPTRLGGLVARLRRFAMGCQGAEANWNEMLLWSQRLPSQVAAYLFSEALWALSLAESAEEMGSALRILQRAHVAGQTRRNAVRRAVETLLSRLMWHSDAPLSVARLYYRHKGSIEVHSQRDLLLMRVARALAGLDLPQAAFRVLSPLIDGHSRRHVPPWLHEMTVYEGQRLALDLARRDRRVVLASRLKKRLERRHGLRTNTIGVRPVEASRSEIEEAVVNLQRRADAVLLTMHERTSRRASP